MSETLNPKETEPTQTLGEWMRPAGGLLREVEANKIFRNHSETGLIVPQDQTDAMHAVASMMTGTIATHPDLAGHMNVMAMELDATDGSQPGYMIFTGNLNQNSLNSVGSQIAQNTNLQLEALGSPLRIPE